MPKKKHTQRLAFGRLAGTAALCVLSAFAIGVRSAGDVQPVSLLQANELTPVSGDFDGDGRLTAHDAVTALEIVEGYEEATPTQLRVDPDQDGRITVVDALTVLRTLPQ